MITHPFYAKNVINKTIVLRIIPITYPPIVDMNVVVKASSENLKSIHVLPTPESPISNNLNKRS